MKVWVVGAEGMLGRALCSALDARGIPFVATDRDVDITCLEAPKAFALEHTPTHIVNCAAYTDVDGAEKNTELARALNRDGPAHLAHIANAVSARLVHVSTDYVFDGEKGTLYVETDAPCPINAYGQTKLEGEQEVEKIAQEWTIVRTSWLFEPNGHNFLSKLVHLLDSHESVRLVSDQINRPTLATELAEALIDLLDTPGLFHYASAHPLTRVEIARDFLKHKEFVCKTVTPVLSSEFPSLARRPLNTALSTEKVSKVLGRTPKTWEQLLIEVFHAS